MPLFSLSAVRSFKTGKFILALTGVLVATVCGSPSSHAAVSPITFSAGTETVSPFGNGYVSVPITVSSTLTGNDVYWLNTSFNLTWNSSVLVLQSTSPLSVSLNGSPLSLTLNGNFGNPSAGQLNFTWSDLVNFVGAQVPNGSTLFTVNFKAVGAWGSSTAISFGSVAQINLTDSTGQDFTQVTPAFVNGGVTVVPEPINWALGLFACAFIGSSTVRWASNRKMALQGTQTVPNGEPRH
jgi:hypothetical protein